MSVLQFTVKTKHRADVLKDIITKQVLSRTEVQALLHDFRWEGTTLHASGAMGSGTLVIRDYAVDVHITLSVMGALAKGTFQKKITSLLESAEPKS